MLIWLFACATTEDTAAAPEPDWVTFDATCQEDGTVFDGVPDASEIDGFSVMCCLEEEDLTSCHSTLWTLRDDPTGVSMILTDCDCEDGGFVRVGYLPA